MKIKTVSIENFKSIRECKSFELNDINILIGSNGVGKTNFISFFTLLKKIADSNLQDYIAEHAGANNLLYFGREMSEHITGRIDFDNNNAYQIELKPNDEDSLYFADERAIFNYYSEPMGTGHLESKLDAKVKNHPKYYQGGVSGYVQKGLSDFEVYHFHDTSKKSPIKQTCQLHDNFYLRRNGSNLAAYLYLLKQTHPISLSKIEKTIKQIAPFFDSFILQPSRLEKDQIRLEWKENGSDMIFNANQLSDGTIRMIALTTLLLQPNPSPTIIIDEPELGLHPAAINLLASLIKKCSSKSQLIISTQSVTLVNQFTPDDIIIAERENKQTTFKRLSDNDISQWLDDYGLGDAWEKNVFGGRP